MKNVNIQEYYSLVTEKVPRVIVLTYNGEDDPVDQLNKAVAECERAGFVYKEYIDANMDNPWQRILLLQDKDTNRRRFLHVPTNKIYITNGAGSILPEDKSSNAGFPLWLTENSTDFREI